jgi:hypothetical protein
MTSEMKAGSQPAQDQHSFDTTTDIVSVRVQDVTSLSKRLWLCRNGFQLGVNMNIERCFDHNHTQLR